MDAQTLLPLLLVYEPTDPAPTQPILASSADYGFDLDEEEVGREMLASLPIDLFASPANLQETGDEFEQVYQCFLS